MDLTIALWTVLPESVLLTGERSVAAEHTRRGDGAGGTRGVDKADCGAESGGDLAGYRRFSRLRGDANVLAQFLGGSYSR